MMEERKQEIGAEPDQVFEIFLRPGELYWSNDSATRIRTLLGSCVAICLWHPRRKIGGMCHYLLPRRSDRAGAGPDPRYGDEAMELFLAEIGAATTRPSQYVAKVFGGGNMFEKINVSGSIGDGNVQLAREMLGRHGIRIVAGDMGGVQDRRLMFDLWSGDAWLKRKK